MLVHSLYRFKVIKPNKVTRYDLIASTGDYEPIESLATKGKTPHLYERPTDTYSAPPERRAGLALTNGKQNVSSVFFDLKNPCMAYGDMQGTHDALLFLFSPDFKEVEIIVARNGKHLTQQLFQLFLKGDLDYEIEMLRAAAKEVTPILK